MRKAAGRRGLLHARGDVDRDAADAAIGIDAAAEQHAAGVDADADVEAVVAVRRPHFGAERLAELEQGQAAAHGALGVVFAGFVGTEGGQDAVAGVLQHLAGVRLDDGRAARQGVVHDRADRLGVEVLGERGRADHVEEQDADLPEASAPARTALRPGGSAPPSLALAADRSGFDDRIPQRRPLTFQGGNRGFELLLLSHRRRA